MFIFVKRIKLKKFFFMFLTYKVLLFTFLNILQVLDETFRISVNGRATSFTANIVNMEEYL